jgi:hypothetical protein
VTSGRNVANPHIDPTFEVSNAETSFCRQGMSPYFIASSAKTEFRTSTIGGDFMSEVLVWVRTIVVETKGIPLEQVQERLGVAKALGARR